MASFSRDSFLEPLRAVESLLEGYENGPIATRLDVREDEQRYIIQADMPGFSRDDVSITFESGMLTLDAERTQKVEDGKENFHIRECRVRRVSRSRRLPNDVKPDSIHASLKDGVLTITVDKQESARPHKIEVSTG